MKRFLTLLMVLTLSAAVLAGCSSGNDASATLNSVGTSVDGNEVAIEKASMKLVNTVNDGGYELIGTEELNTWTTEGKEMIIIDTMPADSYAKGRIPGALNAELPKTGMADVTAEQKEAFTSLLGTNKDIPVVVYCGFVACERSDVGAVIAKELGYNNVYRCPGGIIAWENAGYATEK
ncbi:rhodanese-like domain-containing protein [Proteocatella sphenisci]|uniref:rhodanese-like domain-containing protein n=1 Tax=Proteocatella sphenisci TaxID=181070 RepID=UPI00048EDAF6|nr:rhodanese-like domain-containing protein [Proteocatella sphenisci]